MDRLQLYALLAPHLEVGGWGNSARRMCVAGNHLLAAWKGSTYLAMGANVGLTRASCGYVGASDGWQDLSSVVDTVLKVDTPFGPCWHRYNHDGYGPRSDGRPFDGWGKGRAWPLLTGERGHYELAAGREVQQYIRAWSNLLHEVECCQSKFGMKQIGPSTACAWDAPPDLPCL